MSAVQEVQMRSPIHWLGCTLQACFKYLWYHGPVTVADTVNLVVVVAVVDIDHVYLVVPLYQRAETNKTLLLNWDCPQQVAFHFEGLRQLCSRPTAPRLR